MSIRMGLANSEPGHSPPEPALPAHRPTAMTSPSMSRGTAAAVAALMLGGGFVVGSHSGRPAVAATFPLAPAAAGTTPTAAGITVTGTAQVAGRPDTLRLDLSVSVTEDSVSRALDKANGTTARVQSALGKGGVAAKDVQTSNLQIQPEYTYPSNGGPILKGYTVTEGVTATLRDLAKAGSAITSAVGAGGNAVQVNGISLDLQDNGSLLKTARDKAVDNAKAKAEQYAKASGRDLGPVVSLTETVSDTPPIAYAAADRMAASPVPIKAGTQDVGVTVTVVYAFST